MYLRLNIIVIIVYSLSMYEGLKYLFNMLKYVNIEDKYF